MRFKKLASTLLMASPLALLCANVHAAELSARLVGFEETPAAIFSKGSGKLDLDLDRKARTLTYKLTFSGLSSPATQSHIHFGKRHVTGGVTVFFCTNLSNGPAGTQPCPAGGGTVTGTITGGDVLAIAAQAMPAGDFDALVTLLTSDTAYANVHTTNFPSGEIRGQIRFEERGKDHW